MKKVEVGLDSNEEVVKMILDVFKGRDGARNLVNILKAKTDKHGKLYDKVFSNAIHKSVPEIESILKKC